MHKIIALCVFSVLAILGCSFLYFDKLSGVSFVLFVSVLIVSLLAFYFGDRLKEFDMKNLRMILIDIKSTVEESRTLGESIAEFHAYNVATSNRWGSDGHIYKRWEQRQKIELFLQSLGATSEKINENLSILDRYITMDLFNQLLKKARTHNDMTNHNDWFDRIRDNLLSGQITTIDTDDVKRHLDEAHVNMSGIESELSRLDTFVRNKELLQ